MSGKNLEKKCKKQRLEKVVYSEVTKLKIAALPARKLADK
jgi:hypothetical protein